MRKRRHQIEADKSTNEERKKEGSNEGIGKKYIYERGRMELKGRKIEK